VPIPFAQDKFKIPDNAIAANLRFCYTHQTN